MAAIVTGVERQANKLHVGLPAQIYNIPKCGKTEYNKAGAFSLGGTWHRYFRKIFFIQSRNIYIKNCRTSLLVWFYLVWYLPTISIFPSKCRPPQLSHIYFFQIKPCLKVNLFIQLPLTCRWTSCRTHSSPCTQSREGETSRECSNRPMEMHIFKWSLTYSSYISRHSENWLSSQQGYPKGREYFLVWKTSGTVVYFYHHPSSPHSTYTFCHQLPAKNI